MYVGFQAGGAIRRPFFFWLFCKKSLGNPLKRLD
nr:MAG TPA: hypothetical protein [Caudoviricetes sp.]